MEIEVDNKLMLYVDNDRYKISEDNYIKTKTEKKQILISFSLRKKNHHIVRLQHNELGKSKNWNTYTIDRNGNVFQHFDSDYYSNYLNDNKVNKQIISIVLENMGGLIKLSNGDFVNSLNEICNNENVVEKKWLNYSYWEKITNEQFNNLVSLCRVLLEKHKIPLNFIEFQHYHKNISKYNGIVFKSNYIDDFTNINPMFNIEEFNRNFK